MLIAIKEIKHEIKQRTLLIFSDCRGLPWGFSEQPAPVPQTTRTRNPAGFPFKTRPRTAKTVEK